jgi:hypothetical protein
MIIVVNLLGTSYFSGPDGHLRPRPASRPLVVQSIAHRLGNSFHLQARDDFVLVPADRRQHKGINPFGRHEYLRRLNHVFG